MAVPKAPMSQSRFMGALPGTERQNSISLPFSYSSCLPTCYALSLPPTFQNAPKLSLQVLQGTCCFTIVCGVLGCKRQGSFEAAFQGCICGGRGLLVYLGLITLQCGDSGAIMISMIHHATRLDTAGSPIKQLGGEGGSKENGAWG